MTDRLFGTDGVRGIANSELTPQLSFELGRAGALVLAGSHKDAKILVGRDTRISGDMLEAALISGICSVGVNVIKAGVIPTPGVAYLTRYTGAQAGVVVSASHNPVKYNGIKFFDDKGYKLSDEKENEIEQAIKTGKFPVPTGSKIGTVVEYTDGWKKYKEFLQSTIDVDLKGLKLGIDCGNGAVHKLIPTVFSELGAEVEVINNTPDGNNINVGCGSTNPEAVRQLVLNKKCDVGLSFDGDADRVIPVDERGTILNGDHIMAICAAYLKTRNRLPKDTVVATVMSNIGLEIALREKGCKMVRTKVGDRYILQEMLDKGYSFGGEQSGHVIFLEHTTTGDGLLTALQLLSVMKKENKPLSELSEVLKVMPQVLLNARVKNKNGIYSNKRIQEAIRKAEEILKGKGRVVVRPSGTEPLVRIMMEGPDEELIKKMTHELVEVVEKQLN